MIASYEFILLIGLGLAAAIKPPSPTLPSHLANCCPANFGAGAKPQYVVHLIRSVWEAWINILFNIEPMKTAQDSSRGNASTEVGRSTSCTIGRHHSGGVRKAVDERVGSADSITTGPVVQLIEKAPPPSWCCTALFMGWLADERTAIRNAATPGRVLRARKFDKWNINVASDCLIPRIGKEIHDQMAKQLHVSQKQPPPRRSSHTFANPQVNICQP